MPQSKSDMFDKYKRRYPDKSQAIEISKSHFKNWIIL